MLLKFKIFLIGILFFLTLLPAKAEITFSSYTKGLYKVTEIQKDNHVCQLTITLPYQFIDKIEKKMSKNNQEQFYINIDGIKSVVKSTQQQGDQVLIHLEIPTQTFDHTTLSELKIGDQVSIGLPSSNIKKSLISDEPVYVAQHIETKMISFNHRTLELTFESSSDIYDLIHKSQWIGINGSGFYVHDVSQFENKVKFKVYANRHTREFTIFNNTLNQQKVNITSQVF